LAALGVSDSAVANASLGTEISDGLTTITHLAEDVYGNSPAHAAAGAQWATVSMVQVYGK